MTKYDEVKADCAKWY